MTCLRSTTTGPSCLLSQDIYIYLELACHDKQNCSQRFIVRPRIVELMAIQREQKLKKFTKIVNLSLRQVYGDWGFWDTAKDVIPFLAVTNGN